MAWTLYAPAVPGPAIAFRADLVVHAAVFALSTVTGLACALRPGRLAVALAANAVISEVVQHIWLPGRSGDPVDVAADLVGIGLGLVAGWWLSGRGWVNSGERSAPGVER
ncbi:hypothetical protein [Serinibacter salmoneus]|uniref:VanZ like protein n=1 Tax=Serinibacter salmoneus TaxID=556530 RepID=A0A2A9D0S2_9MICO|nr:hypothetical protein [Serinibacter salmoneus]PFG20298.1 hypothetical protein ATL40_1895 [Serinibacter salmoneus]